MIVNLTQKYIDTELRVPAGKLQVELCCSELKGLYVLVSARSPGQGTYYFRYKDANGKTCHQKIGRTSDITLADARKQARTLKSEINLGADPRAEAKARKEVPTFDQLWEQYESYAKPRKRSFGRDEQLYRIRIKGKFGKMRLNQISRHMIQSFHTELLAEGLAPASCDHHLKLMKHMFNLAHDWSLFDGLNPVTRVPLFNADNRVEHLLTSEQRERLYSVLRTSANRPVCLIVMFLLSTGCRLNEALSAKWVDVDRGSRVWRIPATNSKSKKIRSVPLNDSALDVLKQLDTEDEFEYLFRSRLGGKFSTITKAFDLIRKQAGLPNFRLHDGRHAHASFLVEAGRTLFEVQQILGHSNPTVTQRYAHLSSKTLQEASNSASAIIKSAMQPKVIEEAKAA